MPTSPSSLCLDCSSRAIDNSKYCKQHQTNNRRTENRRLIDTNRSDDPVRKLYRTKRWAATRRTVFQRDLLCQATEGCPHAATVCDHKIDARTYMASGGDFYDLSNLQGLCIAHHNSKTAKECGFAGAHRQQ
jgi:5-methylcytosine-specific restriction endonuclease McrA